jgi:hypothetical protein
MSKYKGTIKTEIGYDDAAETRILNERFAYHKKDVCLSRDSDYVSITASDVAGYEYCYVSVMDNGNLEFGHEYGDMSTTFAEVFKAISFLRSAKSFAKTLTS